MIRTLLSSTALAALLMTGAIAQDAAAPADPNAPAAAAPADPNAAAPAAGTEAGATDAGAAAAAPTTDQNYAATEGDQLVSRILGATVYNSAADDAETIGDINDIVIDGQGNIAAAVIGVGGFLGVGEKNVAINFDALEWVQEEGDDEFRYVLNTTADALNAAPDFVYDDDTAAEQAEDVQEEQGQADPNATTDATEQPAGNAAVAPVPATDAAGGAAAAGAIDRSTLQDLDETTLTAEELEDTPVYGQNDEQIGEIGDFVLNPEGGIDAVIVDVGGFLGIGQKEVAVGFENLNFSVDADNNRYLFLNSTREQLEAQPAFNRDSYQAERDQQRLVVQP